MEYDYLGRKFHRVHNEWYDSNNEKVSIYSFIVDLNKKYIENEYSKNSFRIVDGIWFDSNNEEIAIDDFTKELNEKFLNDEYFNDYNEEDLNKLYFNTKKYNKDLCFKLCINVVNRKNMLLKKTYLPRLTAISRILRKPQFAIDTANKLIEKYGEKVISPHLYTSLAGAYNDLRNYAMADKYNKLALKLNNGVVTEYYTNVDAKTSLGKKGYLDSNYY